jgi:hypothetical protein
MQEDEIAEDEIMAEVRAIRRQIVEECNGDAHTLFEHLRERIRLREQQEVAARDEVTPSFES